jgi:hypothetical protein
MRLLALSVVAATALLVATGAFGATPKEIYRDYADNGRLDRTYSQADVDRALKDAVLQGYGNQNVNAGLAPAAGAAGSAGNSGLPFTGLDLTLMAIGGGALLAGGLGIRRLARARK